MKSIKLFGLFIEAEKFIECEDKYFVRLKTTSGRLAVVSSVRKLLCEESGKPFDMLSILGDVDDLRLNLGRSSATILDCCVALGPNKLWYYIDCIRVKNTCKVCGEIVIDRSGVTFCCGCGESKKYPTWDRLIVQEQNNIHKKNERCKYHRRHK